HAGDARHQPEQSVLYPDPRQDPGARITDRLEDPHLAPPFEHGEPHRIGDQDSTRDERQAGRFLRAIATRPGNGSGTATSAKKPAPRSATRRASPKAPPTTTPTP